MCPYVSDSATKYTPLTLKRKESRIGGGGNQIEESFWLFQGTGNDGCEYKGLEIGFSLMEIVKGASRIDS